MNLFRMVVVVVLVITVATPCFAQFIFEAKPGANQVVAGSDSPASGFSTLELNPGEDTLNFIIVLENLDLDGQQTPGDSTDDVTGLHFHNAPPGSNGGIVFNPSADDNDLMVFPEQGRLEGSWDVDDNTPLTQEQVNNLRSGQLYVNVHTNSHPGGAIRGQLGSPPFVRELRSTQDPVGIREFFDQSNLNSDIPHILDLDCSGGDPLILDQRVDVHGDLTVIGTGGPDNCEVQSNMISPQPLFQAMDGGELEVEIVALQLQSVEPIRVDIGGNVAIWDVTIDSNGSTPAVVVDGGSFDANLAVFRVDCIGGGAWTVDAVNSNVHFNGASFASGDGCINAALDCPNCEARAHNSRFGAPINNTDFWEGRGNIHDDGTWGFWRVDTAWDLPSLEESNFSQRDPGKVKTEASCNDFGTGAFTSLGFNIDTDGSCALDQPTDLPNTDPMIDLDENGIPQLMAGSPAIESGSVDFLNNELPCIYKDLNGLGRPQDFDLDGEFVCDRGPVEVQGGPDIGAAQSAAFYDTGRDGEGVFVEILENGTAVISFYSYSPDGTNMAWFVGVGKVVGNSVVVDELHYVTGGVFGPGFNPAHIVRTPVGGMSLNFPDCEAIENPGMLNFTADPDSGFENLLQKAYRLTAIIDCSDTPPTVNARRSGAFFAPDRSGEGIFVEWLSDGRVVIVFYTFDPDGNPFWLTSVVDPSGVVGNEVTADMLYAEGKTMFGSGFDPDEVMLSSWGTVTLTYIDKNNLTFAYDSTVTGFGAGSHAYTRLTKLLGTE